MRMQTISWWRLPELCGIVFSALCAGHLASCRTPAPPPRVPSLEVCRPEPKNCERDSDCGANWKCILPGRELTCDYEVPPKPYTCGDARCVLDELASPPCSQGFRFEMSGRCSWPCSDSCCPDSLQELPVCVERKDCLSESGREIKIIKPHVPREQWER
jgi:hypothetical protein